MGGQHATHVRQTQVCCSMCGQQFTHGEPRLQQWCNRNSHRAFSHSPCINGGVAHDHELHPKLPADQDSAEQVARQRDCVTQAAADSSSPHQTTSQPPLAVKRPSTRSRETTSKTSRAPLASSSPTRFRFALQQAQHAILRAIMHHDPCSSASLECSRAQQLPPPRTTHNQCFWRQLLSFARAADLTSSRPKTGQPCGPWCGLNVTSLLFSRGTTR